MLQPPSYEQIQIQGKEAWDTFNPNVGYPDETRYSQNPSSVHYNSGITAAWGASFQVAWDNWLWNKGKDYLHVLTNLQNDDSRWLSPEEANRLYPANVPYRNEIKESVAQFYNDKSKRNQLEQKIISNLRSDSIGAQAIPFAASLAGGILDPVNIIGGGLTSVGLKSVGRTLLRSQVGRLGGLGSILSGGKLNDVGKFVSGSIGARTLSEVIDQGIGNTILEYTGLNIDEVQKAREFSVGQLAHDAVIGTIAGVGVWGAGVGISSAFKKAFKKRSLGPTDEIIDQTTANQIEANLVPYIAPIERAHKEGLTRDHKYGDSKSSLDNEFRSPYGEVREADIDFRIDPEGRVTPFLKGTNIVLVKNRDFSQRQLYLPLAKMSDEGIYQNYVTTAILNHNSIQLTDSPIVARNASKHPLLFTKDTGTIQSIKVNNIKPIDADVKLKDSPYLNSVLKEIFGEKRFQEMLDQNRRIRDAIVEAQSLGFEKLKKLQDKVLGDGNAMVYTEYPGTSKRYDVVELIEGKDFDVTEMVHDIDTTTPMDNSHIVKAQKELIDYSQDPKNKIGYNPEVEAYSKIVDSVDIPESITQRFSDFEQRIADLEEQIEVLNTLRELEEISETGEISQPIELPDVVDKNVPHGTYYDQSFYNEKGTNYINQVKADEPKRIRKIIKEFAFCRSKDT